MSAVKPYHRFAAFDFQNKLEAAFARLPGRPHSEVAKAIANARYWEGFPDSYTAEQVAAGQALIIESVDPSTDAFVAAVNEVANLMLSSLG